MMKNLHQTSPKIGPNRCARCDLFVEVVEVVKVVEAVVVVFVFVFVFVLIMF